MWVKYKKFKRGSWLEPQVYEIKLHIKSSTRVDYVDDSTFNMKLRELCFLARIRF